MDQTNQKVPLEVGICVDGFGFLGILDLRSRRRQYGVVEFLGVTKDHGSPYYTADFHRNENTEKNQFILRETESTHPAGVYYVSDAGSFDGISRLESYVLFIDNSNYCFFDTVAGNPQPDVRVGGKKWKHYYEVVKSYL
jgi:hypothetical protein